VKLLLDQNLAPRLARELATDFGSCAHVRDFQLQTATDHAVWEFAIQHNYSIVSKDSDFHQLALLRGPPPKVIWIRRGNCTTARILRILKAAKRDIEAFLDDPGTAFLTLE
jgi:predicted nuclease of predicted toxin-antitoxin system